MGVWIEIHVTNDNILTGLVTPYVGVWIEILKPLFLPVTPMSPPMWGCGLKSQVAPYV